MKILVACEESQAVTIEFRKLGHEAYSCDIETCSGWHPEWHIKQDVLPLLNGKCSFQTMDGALHNIVSKWDMIVAFPPCTYLTVTGNKWFNIDKYGEKAVNRWQERLKAIEFFKKIANADCDKIAIENPVGIMSTRYKKPSQIIQPYDFGDKAEKKTCLWTKGLPLLIATDKVNPPERRKYKNGKTMATWYADLWKLPPKERAKARSKTFPGIARAMAEQWAE